MHERVLEEVCLTASDKGAETITVNAVYVTGRAPALAQKGDLSRFIL
jgi:ATP-dependent protease HslVU (ClpYQ) ATPase subunit